MITSSKLQSINTPDWDTAKTLAWALVDFWAPWCAACKVQEKVMEEVANEFDEIAFMTLNVDDNRYLSQQLGVRNIPTMVFYQNGVEVMRFAELISKDQLLVSLKSRINKNS
jgi:thioredoxin 1